MAEAMTTVQVIRKYFFPADAKLQEVAAEIKKLTPEDKAELAAGAAKELGVELREAAA